MRSTTSSSSNAMKYYLHNSLSKVGLLLINAHCSMLMLMLIYVHATHTMSCPLSYALVSYISLASFKCSLLEYYNKALDLYDADNIRTWRTIWPRSNIARTLAVLYPPLAASSNSTLLFFPLIFSVLSMSSFSY